MSQQPSGGKPSWIIALEDPAAVLQFFRTTLDGSRHNVACLLPDWPWSSSQTFQTQSKPDFEPGVWESGSAEYLNLNPLVGSGLST